MARKDYYHKTSFRRVQQKGNGDLDPALYIYLYTLSQKSFAAALSAGMYS